MNRIDEFPQYRKYAHNKTFFKIIDEETFDQLEILGGKFFLNRFEAKVHPDRIYIKDMIEHFHSHWLEIDGSEYEQKLKFCEENLLRVH